MDHLSAVVLQNEFLKAAILPKGAELCSLVQWSSDTEFMWQADPAVWGKHSPILFPIVGSLKNGNYQYEGKSYQMGRHGFARDMDFVVTKQDSNLAVFELQSSATTLLSYPFAFVLRVCYELIGHSLQVRYEVQNIDQQNILFSIGGHPAFRVPIEDNADFESYSLQVAISESCALPIYCYPLSPDGLLLSGQEKPYLLDTITTIPLQRTLFKSDALVFKGIQSAAISLIDQHNQTRWTLDYQNFPYLGLWNKFGADFLCVEPWCGITDTDNTAGILQHKEGIIALQPADTWSAAWRIHIAP